MARRKIDLSTSGEGNIVDIKSGKPVAIPVLPVICERIKHYRELMGMEQKALSRLIGVTPNAVSNWENGRSRPDVNLLPGICDALNITFYDLFSTPDPTIKYTARQQLLVDEFSSLSEGHKQAVENLVDTLSRVEAAENCPDLSILTYFSRQLAAGTGDPTEFIDEGEDIYVDSWQFLETGSTGIQKLSNSQSSNSQLYDLSGRRLSGAQQHRGIVIKQYTDENGVRHSRKVMLSKE